MKRQTKKTNRKLHYELLMVVSVVAIVSIYQYFDDPSVLSQLSKWPRRGVLLLAAVALSWIVSSLSPKIYSAIRHKKSPAN